METLFEELNQGQDGKNDHDNSNKREDDRPIMEPQDPVGVFEGNLEPIAPNQAANPHPMAPNQVANPHPMAPNQAVNPHPMAPNQAVNPQPMAPNQAVNPQPMAPNQVANPHPMAPNQAVPVNNPYPIGMLAAHPYPMEAPDHYPMGVPQPMEGHHHQMAFLPPNEQLGALFTGESAPMEECSDRNYTADAHPTKKMFQMVEFGERAKRISSKIESFTSSQIENTWRKHLVTLIGHIDFDREEVSVELGKAVEGCLPARGFNLETRDPHRYGTVLDDFNKMLEERGLGGKETPAKKGEDSDSEWDAEKGEGPSRDQQLLDFLRNNQTILELFGGDHQELIRYLELNQKFTSFYNATCQQLNKNSMILLNTLAVLETLKENLTIAGQPDYKQQISGFIKNLGLEEQIQEYLKLISQRNVLKPCLQSREYQLKCAICSNLTSEKNHLQLFDPCGHVSCEDCVKQLRHQSCPFCRKDYQKSIRIYNDY
jgi:hypothetical protein